MRYIPKRSPQRNSIVPSSFIMKWEMFPKCPTGMLVAERKSMRLHTFKYQRFFIASWVTFLYYL